MHMQSERAHAAALTGATHGFGVALGEDAHAHGRYHAVFRRVPDSRMGQSIKLAQRLAELTLQLRSIAPSTPAYALCLLAIDRAEREMTEMATEVYDEDHFPNTVLTAGKNFALDSFLAGSSYTAAWYLGLISSASYSAISAADTAASHAGWLEAGAANAPTYSGNRKTAAWSSASGGSKALSAGLVFTFTGAGTVKGGFLGTTNTVDATTGTWYSAGLFTGGDRVVASSDTLTVSYSASL